MLTTTKVDDNFVENAAGRILLDNADNSTVGTTRSGRTVPPMATSLMAFESRRRQQATTLQNNHLRDNVTHDATTMGSGIVGNNHGETSQPPGLCGGTTMTQTSRPQPSTAGTSAYPCTMPST